MEQIRAAKEASSKAEQERSKAQKEAAAALARAEKEAAATLQDAQGKADSFGQESLRAARQGVEAITQEVWSIMHSATARSAVKLNS